jgi:hypothetical protein
LSNSAQSQELKGSREGWNEIHKESANRKKAPVEKKKKKKQLDRKIAKEPNFASDLEKKAGSIACVITANKMVFFFSPPVRRVDTRSSLFFAPSRFHCFFYTFLNSIRAEEP